MGELPLRRIQLAVQKTCHVQSISALGRYPKSLQSSGCDVDSSYMASIAENYCAPRLKED